MSVSAPAIFDRMSALADATRSRLLLVLERHELTVGELCQVLQLPQSTVSRHLKLLGDEGWVSARAEGTSRRYRMPADRLDAEARQLWQLVRREVAELAGAAQDAERLRSVLAQRSTRSREFFSSAAGEWDRLRADLFGRRADLLGLLGLVDEAWTVGDLGCGTGQMAASLAPFVARVIAVDGSPAMLEAARARLAGTPNVEVREGELESLPIEPGTLDAAVAFLVLHYVAEPADALAQAARALKPGGRLLVVDMMPHDREEYRQAMGHVWQGFESERLGGWMADAGLTAFRYVPLPPDPAAKGPTLFAASARRSA
ncbi:metalloregulator ArsR/SmtB family transcription factor [Longimicrobium sp.]|jgi:ArsR family transcriptional regulator|uniref:ArsR/SmtB family transcription factor n=1 Tax=Longimicrobium sp. TaxID=2029185 RepID=UPI002ED935F1